MVLLSIKNDKRVSVRKSPVLDSLKKWNRVLMLQTQVLRVRLVNKPCIGLIQENSIENSI